MKKEFNYLASKRRDKVGRQELRSTPYKQEINSRWTIFVIWAIFKVKQACKNKNLNIKTI
jgi:hypothetical protein